jgi:hypothetical protein
MTAEEQEQYITMQIEELLNLHDGELDMDFIAPEEEVVLSTERLVRKLRWPDEVQILPDTGGTVSAEVGLDDYPIKNAAHLAVGKTQFSMYVSVDGLDTFYFDGGLDDFPVESVQSALDKLAVRMKERQ